ncbi:ribonuclease H family protein [Flavobacteriaceae bacterium]|nr:ribonuclease H family protein [Flavobacteriaceae bacterium]
MKKKLKYYVVWEGHKKGVYNSWEKCKVQINNFKGAKYKSFGSLKDANNAFSKDYKIYISKSKLITSDEVPNYNSISVDAASSGNPGIMEYQGVDTKTKKLLFSHGPFKQGTNNIGEFLALVHGLAELKKIKSNKPIYTDSITAISWVRKKKCNTKLERTIENENLFLLVDRAILWLKSNSYETKILKWKTKIWGEIPADFGRK